MANVSVLLAQAQRRGITPPAQKTLDRYGLTQLEWLRLLKAQDWCCPICTKDERRWNTDHEHAPGWEKMPPKERKKYVRGVLCWHCNHKRVHSRYSPGEAARIAAYQEAYERRRDGHRSGT